MNLIKGYKFDKYFLDVEMNRLSKTKDNEIIKLSENDLKILSALVSEYPNSVSKNSLLDKIGHPTLNINAPNQYENSAINKIYKSISTLRDKLSHQAIILGDHGYTLNYPVEIVYKDNTNKDGVINSKHSEIIQDIQTTSAGDSENTRAVTRSYWKQAFFVSATLCIILLVFFILFVLFVQRDKPTDNLIGNENNDSIKFSTTKRDEGLTKITIDKAFVNLDMNNGWKDLSQADIDSSQKLSKSTVYYNYKARKYFETETFSHRVGTSRIISPEWMSDDQHRIIDTEDIDDITRKCSNSARISKMLYFDVSKEPTNKPFDLVFSVDYFNAHNQKQKEYQNYFIHRPIETLEFKVSFPKTMHFPEAIRILKAQNCFNEFIEQNKHNKSENQNDYVVEDKDLMTITWYVKNPVVNNTYRIEWDWEKTTSNKVK